MVLQEIRLAPVGSGVKESKPANLACELTNFQLEYVVNCSQELADEVLSY